MNETLDRATRAVVDATLKQAKKEGFSIQGGAATHLTEVLAPKIVLAVITSLSDPTPECVEAMAREVNKLDEGSLIWDGQRLAPRFWLFQGVEYDYNTPEGNADYFKALDAAKICASHAAFIRYVERK